MDTPLRDDAATGPARGRVLRARLAGLLPVGEDGSLVTEYGLIAVIGATLAGLAIRWASGGAIAELFAAILTKVKSVVGV